MRNYTRLGCRRCETTLVSSVFFRIRLTRLMIVKTQLSWPAQVRDHRKASEITLETSVKDVKLHSKRVKKIQDTLETSEEDVKTHSKRVEKIFIGLVFQLRK